MKKSLILAAMLAVAATSCADGVERNQDGTLVPMTFVCFDGGKLVEVVGDVVMAVPPVGTFNGRLYNGPTWKLTTTEEVDVYYVQPSGEQCWVRPSDVVAENW